MANVVIWWAVGWLWWSLSDPTAGTRKMVRFTPVAASQGLQVPLPLDIQMPPDHPIVMALRRIAEVLTEAGDCPTTVASVQSLVFLAISENPDAQVSFKKEITTNKWYWLGMGTIADISFSDRELTHKFVSAYYDLAIACEQTGYDSIYSKDVKRIFGQWLDDGAV